MMLRYLILTGLLLFLSSGTVAATRNVKGSCANNGDGTTSACAGSPGGVGAYNTIQACATAMAAGDTCTVFAGTYNETVTLGAGTSGNFKTLNVNGSDVVTVQGFVAASYSKIIGFNIQFPSTPSSGCISIPNGTQQLFITNNIISQCGVSGSSQINVSYPSTATFVYIQGNTLSYACVQSGVQVSTTGTFSANTNSMTVGSVGGAQNTWVVYGAGLDVSSGVRIASISGTTLTLSVISGGGFATNANETNTPITLSPAECNSIYSGGDHWLVENNDFSHYTLSIDFLTANSVYRNNTFHDQYQAEAGGNSHTDTFFSEPGVSVNVQNNLIEGNTQRNAFGVDSKGSLSQGADCGGTCSVLIERFNIASRVGGGITTNDQTWDAVKSYNNTWVDSLSDNLLSCGNPPATENNLPELITWATTRTAELNNIYYYTQSAAHTGCFNPYSVSTTNGSSASWGNNLLYCSGGCGTAYGHLYQTGTFAAEPGHVVANPNFVNYVSAGSTSNDYHLQVGSPAIGAGTSLTTAVGSGSGSTALTVADASYFQDGYGITGVRADWIRVGSLTTSPKAQISSINYSTNVITLASSITWANNDPVYLYKNSNGTVQLLGASPDIGAFQYANTPPACGACRLMSSSPTPGVLFAKKGH